MPEAYTLCRLLERWDEPSPFMLHQVAESVIQYPEQIRNLVVDGNEEETLVHLNTRSHRLATIFQRLHDFQTHHVKSPATQQIAKASTSFIFQTLTDLHAALEPAQLVALLIPALATCLTACPPSTLREIAKQLVRIPNLLGHLACDNEGGRVIKLWVNSTIFTIQDAETLTQWTEVLAHMVSSCPDSHEASDIVQDWESLRRTHDALSEILLKRIEAVPKALKDTRTSAIPNGLVVASSSDQFCNLNNLPEIAKVLNKFKLPMPQSERGFANVIESLKGEKTRAILKQIGSTFPCSICRRALIAPRPLNQIAVRPAPSQRADSKPEELMQFLGNVIGEWKVFLSVSAFESIQTHFHHIGAIPRKLVDLSSGHWEYETIGSEEQRKALRVPLAVTRCDQALLILWQVDVEATGESQMAQQIIIIWAVGEEAVIDKSINRVILIQKTYSREHCQRCRKKPALQGKKFLPFRFGDTLSTNNHQTQGGRKLDVTDVDPETIDMANKFYALTKPLMRAIITNNLTAEFPFSLSTDEFKVINHFDTASLILGRSGTGKTTCLVFKLVSKYLARKAIVDEKPVRQVLLTRSSFLSDKLRDYCKRLIEGQISQTVALAVVDSGQPDDWSSATEATTTADVLTIQDEMFPLVLTYVQFLQILENTVRALDRTYFDDNDGTCEDRLVTVQDFILDYWPRFPTNVAKNLSAHLVFPEILGVIKGSVSSTKTLVPLSREEYLDLSPRIAPSFPSQIERSTIYTIFQHYESMKKSKRGFDLVDRVVRMIKAIRGNANLERILAAAFHEVYIDEVQDHQCIDFGLFLSFIKDARGIHCAGDTAQAISQDSTFRFNDPKGLFYEHFAAASKETGQDLSRPKLFTLNKNYRSHQGILAVASMVMDLLWKGFPETIDKLEPEIGRLAGPRPVLFLNCTPATFISGTEDDIKFSKRAVEFGAEQVILVRDEQMKEKLREDFGEAALILTILESKGMEFDDVVLWNFFEHPAPATTARKLRALYKEAAKFDSKKYWSLCSDLKHLYVAVTRARMQLCFVESSAEHSRHLISLLTEDVAEPLVEVTQPGHPLFPEKLMSLLPGDAIEPLKWAARGQQLMQLQNYKDAAMCFKKAGEKRAEIVALAKMQEENARRCKASGDAAQFKVHIEAAINHFLHAGLREDASICLVRMLEYIRAAKLWLNDPPRDIIKAASLYLEANLHSNAAVCFRVMGCHREAADALIKGKKHDDLVLYLSRNLDQFSTKYLLSFARLCKLLLKRNEINPLHRKYAIALLGTADEQEAAFVHYGMQEDLANLLAHQHRHKELFDLYVEKGNLEQALETALIGNQESIMPIVHETTVVRLLHYFCAGTFYNRQDGLSPSILISGRIKSKLPTHLVSIFDEWTACRESYSEFVETGKNCFPPLQDRTVMAFISFQLLIYSQVMSELDDFDNIPILFITLAIALTKKIEIEDNKAAWSMILVAAGVWIGDEDRNLVVLPWSPLQETLSGVTTERLRITVKQWVLSRLSSMILSFETKARGLFMTKWPYHCSQFLISGFCSRKRRGEPCRTTHEFVGSSKCSSVIEDVLQMSGALCELNVLHSHKVLTPICQRTFLPIRRYWLERLLRELTWLNGYEQDAFVIRKTQKRLFELQEFSTVRSSLENLLYHRLGKGWNPESTYSSILEQIQISKLFVRDVQTRHFRSVALRLNTSKNGASKRMHLQRLDTLEWEAEAFKPAGLKQGLALFLDDVTKLSAPNLDAMHAVTSTFEHIALYLLFKSCASALMVPQAWLDLYLPRLPHSALPDVPLPWTEKFMYREMLDQLIYAFCSLMERLDGPLVGMDFRYKCSGRVIFPPSLLQQRNVDFLVILVVNLHANANVPTEHNRAFAAIQRVLNFDSVRSPQLRFKTVDELRNKLAPSFAAYQDKNPLVVALRNSDPTGFKAILAQKGVLRTTFDELRARMRPVAAITGPLKVEAPKDEEIKTDQLTEAEMEAISTIEQKWPMLQPKIERHRAWLQTSEARLVARFIKLGEAYPVTMRRILVSRGIHAQDALTEARTQFSVVRKHAMDKLDIIDPSDKDYENFEDNLQKLHAFGRELKVAEGNMKDHCLQKVIDQGDHAALDSVFSEVFEIASRVMDFSIAIDKFIKDMGAVDVPNASAVPVISETFVDRLEAPKTPVSRAFEEIGQMAQTSKENEELLAAQARFPVEQEMGHQAQMSKGYEELLAAQVKTPGKENVGPM